MKIPAACLSRTQSFGNARDQGLKRIDSACGQSGGEPLVAHNYSTYWVELHPPRGLIISGKPVTMIPRQTDFMPFAFLLLPQTKALYGGSSSNTVQDL